MSVKIRLRRMGKKKQPHYRIVVADSRSPRDGRFVENLGYYNPIRDPARLVVDLDRVDYWLGQGAILTRTVGNLVTKARAGGDDSVALGDRAADAVAADNGQAPEAEATPEPEAAPEAEADAAPEAEATPEAEADAAPDAAAAEGEAEPEADDGSEEADAPAEPAATAEAEAESEPETASESAADDEAEADDASEAADAEPAAEPAEGETA